MKKKSLLCIGVVMAFSLTGCNMHTTMSATYNVLDETVKVELDTSDNMKLSIQNNYFEIQDNDGNILSTGCFADGDTYNNYYNSVTGNYDYEEDTINGSDYLYYEVEGASETEYNYLVDIGDSNVYAIVGNIDSRQSAKDVMDHLTFIGSK